MQTMGLRSAPSLWTKSGTCSAHEKSGDVIYAAGFRAIVCLCAHFHASLFLTRAVCAFESCYKAT